MALRFATRPPRSRPASGPSRWALSVLVFVAVLAAGARLRAQEAEGPTGDEPDRRVGYFIKVPAPVTSDVYTRVRDALTKVVNAAAKQGARPVVVFQLQSGENQYGQTSDLAKLISGPQLAGATTVAYIPEGVDLTGHAVLLALACGEIMMHPDAQIGDAGRHEEALAGDVRSGYSLIAKRRRTIDADLALGMLDPALEVWQVDTNLGRDFVLSTDLAEVRERVTLTGEPQVLIPAGEAGLFTGSQGRELGFVGYLADDLASVAKRLGLRPDALRQDPSLFDDWRPVRIDLTGAITPGKSEQIQRTIETQIQEEDANFICVWIDSAGGSLESSNYLATYLAGLDPAQRRTVAYVPIEARGDAMLVALACDHIVLGEDAILGGAGELSMSETDVTDTLTFIREIAAAKSRSWSLFAAMYDSDLEVHRYTREDDGLVQYFAAEELGEQDEPARWARGPEVTVDGQFFEATGQEAVEYGLAYAAVPGFDELKALYGLEDDPTLAEPGWADQLILALANPSVAWFLLFIGFAALYAELQMPGIGIGGLVAAICFLLYFWANFLGGTADWLEGLMFVAGVVFLLLEIFVLPGFGLFGVAGGLMILASLVLASQTFIFPRNEYQYGELRDSMLMLSGAGVCVIAAIALMRRYLPHTSFGSHVILQPPQEHDHQTISESEDMTRYEHLVGTTGKTISKLTPSGKARFAGEVYHVITDGDAIAPGTDVIVVSARANRILVRPLD